MNILFIKCYKIFIYIIKTKYIAFICVTNENNFSVIMNWRLALSSDVHSMKINYFTIWRLLCILSASIITNWICKHVSQTYKQLHEILNVVFVVAPTIYDASCKDIRIQIDRQCYITTFESIYWRRRKICIYCIITFVL